MAKLVALVRVLMTSEEGRYVLSAGTFSTLVAWSRCMLIITRIIGNEGYVVKSFLG